MAETANIAVIDGESIADVSPWEFDAVVEDAGNSFELSSDAALHGLKGYKVSFGGTNDIAYGKKEFAAQTDIYVREYIYLPSGHYPFSGTGTLRSWYAGYVRGEGDGGTFVAYYKIVANDSTVYFSTFYYQTDAGMQNTAISEVISPDTPHYIEIHYKAGDGDGEAELLVDGASIASVDSLANNSVSVTYFQSGLSYATVVPANGEYFYIDDILIATTGPLGSYKKWWAPIVESDTIAGLATAAETELNDNYTLTSGTVPQIAAYRGLENNFQGCLLFHGQEV